MPRIPVNGILTSAHHSVPTMSVDQTLQHAEPRLSRPALASMLVAAGAVVPLYGLAVFWLGRWYGWATLGRWAAVTGLCAIVALTGWNVSLAAIARRARRRPAVTVDGHPDHWCARMGRGWCRPR